MDMDMVDTGNWQDWGLAKKAIYTALADKRPDSAKVIINWVAVNCGNADQWQFDTLWGLINEELEVMCNA